MRRIRGYGRGSTAKQVETVAQQEEAIRAYARYHWPDEEVVFYGDHAVSSKVPFNDRKGGHLLLSELNRGDVLIFYRLDRAFRNTKEFLCVVDDLVKRRDVKVHFVNMGGSPIDLSSPLNKMTLTLLACFAEFERDMASLRTKEALAHRAALGLKHSRYPGYGFKFQTRWVNKVRERVRVPDHEERAMMKRIVALKNGKPQVDFVAQVELFRKEGLIAKTGRPWTVDRIKRAYKAELNLQLKEMKGVK